MATTKLEHGSNPVDQCDDLELGAHHLHNLEGRSLGETRKIEPEWSETIAEPWKLPWEMDPPLLVAFQSGGSYTTSSSGEMDRSHSEMRSALERSIDLKKIREEETDSVSSGDSDIEKEGSSDDTPKLALVTILPSTSKPVPRFQINKTAVHYGIRLSAVLTISSLFVLAQPPDTQVYPQGLWVYMSALMVSWFPASRDAASVVEKIFQQILGTCIGACLGIGCGFLSLLMPDFKSQAVFMGACIMLVTFLYSFATVQFTKSIMAKYLYSSLLCLITFGIAILPFYTDEAPRYKKGVFRIVNVVVGCIIGAFGAVCFWPRSTKAILKEKIQTQVQLAGEASDAVLRFASDAFVRRISERHLIPKGGPLSLKHVLGGEGVADDEEDILSSNAHEAYNKALAEWKGVSAVFPLYKWDPLNFCGGDTEQDSEYRKDVALALACTLRIQTTVVLLDGLIRNEKASVFSQRQLSLFQDIGVHIKAMLNPLCDDEESEAAAETLLDLLDDVRGFLVNESSRLAAAAAMYQQLFSGSRGKDDYKARLRRSGDDNPLRIRSHDNCSLLFLQLVEHLIVRSLRLYFIWKQVSLEK